jgi:hypothetical protein
VPSRFSCRRLPIVLPGAGALHYASPLCWSSSSPHLASAHPGAHLLCRCPPLLTEGQAASIGGSPGGSRRGAPPRAPRLCWPSSSPVITSARLGAHLLYSAGVLLCSSRGMQPPSVVPQAAGAGGLRRRSPCPVELISTRLLQSSSPLPCSSPRYTIFVCFTCTLSKYIADGMIHWFRH